MPKIEKIRITGVQYDKMRKKYEDALFDLTNEEEPQHALLTLVNGGGKGLLLQMLFQVVMPLTTWGKNGENHIDALFYNERQQFVPYTFHVALEWRLDTDPVEWLVTGICVTAEHRQGQDGDDTDTEPQYFLYTGKYHKPADWHLGTLPIYDEAAQTAVPYEDWQTWLKQHKQQFDLYTKSKQQAYYQYLATYGIERTEWRHMKEINRDEGGIEHYFKRGLDNFGLFHHLMIPEISAYLQDDQGEDLIHIFKNSAVIAQKLPELLKREQSYEAIGRVLEPLRAILEDGYAVESRLQEHQDQANLLYYGMEAERQSYGHEQQKWIEEKKKTEVLQAEYAWQEANLEYAGQRRAELELSHQLESSKDQVQSLKISLEQQKAEKKALQVDILLAEYARVSQEYAQIEKQISRLELAGHDQDEQERVRGLEKEVRVAWQDIVREMKRDVARHDAMVRRNDQERRVLERQAEQTGQQVLTIRTKLETYKAQMKQHNEKAVAMQQTYGQTVNHDPQAVYKKQLEQLEQLDKQIALVKAEVEELHEQKARISQALGMGEAELVSLKSDHEQKANARQHRLEAEQKLHQAWCRYRQVETVFEPYTADTWNEWGRQVDQVLARLQAELESLQKDFWKHQLDAALVNDHFWLPNDDVRNMKEKLEESGIHAVYGTELIAELSEEERGSLREHASLLPYGLVIHQQDWDERFDPDVFAQMLVHAPVPIFIREQMNEHLAYPFRLVEEQGIGMAYDRESWLSWKERLSEAEAYLADAMAQRKERLHDVKRVADQVRSLRETMYERYVQEEENSKSRVAEQQRLQQQRKHDLSRIDTQLPLKMDEIRTHEQLQKDGQKRLDELQRWVEEHRRFVQIQTERAEAVRKSSEIDAGLQKLKKQLADHQEEQRRWEELFFRWKVGCESACTSLQEMVADARFPDHGTVGDQGKADDDGRAGDHGKTRSDDMEDDKVGGVAAGGDETEGPASLPHLRQDLFQDVSPLLKQWQLLQQKLNNRNSELAEWRIKRSYCQQEKEKIAANLDQLERLWKEREARALPKELLQARLEQVERTLMILDGEHRDAEKNDSKLQGQLEQMAQTIQSTGKRIADHHRRTAEAWLNVDLESKKNEILPALARLKDDLRDQQLLIQELDGKGQRLEKQQDILKTHIHVIRELGDAPAVWKERIREQPEQMVEEWMAGKKQMEQQKETFQRHYKDRLRELAGVVQQEAMDGPLRKNMNQLVLQLESNSVRASLDVVQSVIAHIQLELQRLKQDKQSAEEAKEIWVERAVYRVYSILQALRRMVNRMKIKNKEGHLFPLVDIEHLNEIVNTGEEEYQRLLREYFIQTVEKLLDHELPIDQLSEKELQAHISDSQLVLTALRSRYPTLYIYKPQTTNAFLYEKPRKHHYTTWETLNKGSRIEAKGSGGQLLAARTIIMMMIMTIKSQAQSNNWSVLITDNPFGQAVSAHVLDPIFSIADILRFQWIVLAPPELIKLDVSRRFPVYWKLDLAKQNRHEIVTEVLQHGGRTFDDVTDLFDLDFGGEF